MATKLATRPAAATPVACGWPTLEKSLALARRQRKHRSPTGGPQRGTATVVKAQVRGVAAAPLLNNFARYAKHLYTAENSKIMETARPFSEVESTLDLLSEASLDLGANSMLESPHTACKIVRLAEFIQPEEWQRSLDDWEPPALPEPTADMGPVELSRVQTGHAEEQFHSMVRHLLLQYDDAPRALLNCFAPLHGTVPAQHWARMENPFFSADTWLLSQRFARVLAGLGAGQSAAKTLQAHISPKLSKPMAHAFMQTPDDVGSPLHALRTAQVVSMGGSPKLGIEACNSTLGTSLGPLEEEEFVQSMLLWMCDREAELSKVSKSSLMNHLMASFENARREEKPFSMKGKTVNSVLKSVGDVHELFYPSALDSLEFEGEDEAGVSCTIRVEEILSAVQLLDIGQKMSNCLSTGRGLYKYCARARTRSSSFWTITYNYPEDGQNVRPSLRGETEHALIFEVWNQSRIIHQAEGPGSRYPSEAALKHMATWADEVHIDWTTWEVW